MTSKAAGLYTRLESFREPFLELAREAARLTIPSLMRESGAAAGGHLDLPVQTLGAEGLNNLASKLTLGLFPPGQAFFRFTVSPSDEIALGQTETGMEEVQQILGLIEREVTAAFETENSRDQLHEALLHTALTGNGLLYLPPKSKDLEFFRLDQYVVERDPSGNLLTVVTKESVDPDTLPAEMRDLLPKDGTEGSTGGANRPVDLYTVYELKDGMWYGFQEVAGVPVPGSDGKYTKDELPFLALRWSPVAKEYYGRGHIELHMGALRSLDSLTNSIVKGSAAAARTLLGVNPNAVGFSATDMARLPNGAVFTGREEDYWFLRTDKAQDFAVAASTAERLERSLSRAFLLNSSVQRNAERVTATEIRLLAQELESALGGVFALLRAEFQLPIVRWLLRRLKAEGRVQALPDGVEITVLTGLEALGRGQEAEKLRLAAEVAQSMFPNGEALQYFDSAVMVRRIFDSFGVPNVDALLKSEEELAQEAAEARAQALVTEGAPALNQVAQAAAALQQQQAAQ